MSRCQGNPRSHGDLNSRKNSVALNSEKMTHVHIRLVCLHLILTRIVSSLIVLEISVFCVGVSQLIVRDLNLRVTPEETIQYMSPKYGRCIGLIIVLNGNMMTFF